MDIWHNIKIQISSVLTQDLTEDMHTFLTFPYQMLWHKYDARVASLYFMCFMCAICFFTRTSVLSILAFIFEFKK